MNITNDNENEYYKKIVLEIGILQEEIILPPLPEEELTLAVLRNYAELEKPYALMQNCYKNMVGKFYIPSLFPLVDKGDGPEEYVYSGPKTTNSNGTLRPVDKYYEINYVELVIPKYIVMQFRGTIPKDTKFLIGFNGEDREISNLNVVGIYGAELEIDEETKKLY